VKRPSTKQVLVNTFGGKCALCGYNRCLAALEFHHRDPSKKDFQISSFKKKAVDDYLLVRELEQCILVCACCHREIHQGMHKEEVEGIPPINPSDLII
jgi:hypothetical protein